MAVKRKDRAIRFGLAFALTVVSLWFGNPGAYFAGMLAGVFFVAAFEP